MLRRAEQGSVTFTFNGAPLRAREGDSIASALLAYGISSTRCTPLSGAMRGPFCMMGACFDCLAIVDGVPSVQTCLTTVREGMRVTLQDGARALQTEP